MGILSGPLSMLLGGGGLGSSVPTPARADRVPTGNAEDGTGQDISAISDLDPTFELKSGRQVLAEALVRRLMTDRGTLFYAPNYGTDVRNFTNRTFDNRTLGRMRSFIAAELKSDERVKTADVTLDYDSTTGMVQAYIEVLGQDGPFSLTLAISDLDVSLLAVA